MTSKELQVKLIKAQDKLTKKEALLKKYEAKINKIKAQIVSKGWSVEAGAYQKHTADGRCATDEAYDCYWTFCDLASAEDSYKNTERAIEEQKQIVEKWAAKVETARKQEKVVESEYPAEFKELRKNLVAEWTRYDIEKKARLRKAYAELGYKEFIKKYNHAGYDHIQMIDEDFRKANERLADAMILNLWNRVKEKVGTPTAYDLLLENGNSYEGLALNGVVTGTDGIATVESILAGGYNIQRLHIRVLVH